MDKEIKLLDNVQSVNSASGNIKGVAYDGRGLMQVHFDNGSVYEYPDTAPSLHDLFAETFDDSETSTGAFFAKHIRMNPFKRLK